VSWLFATASSSSTAPEAPAALPAATILACSSRIDGDLSPLEKVLDGPRARRLCEDRKNVFDHLHPRPLFKSVRHFSCDGAARVAFPKLCRGRAAPSCRRASLEQPPFSCSPSPLCSDSILDRRSGSR
jgi:hypothetical protein